MRMIDDKYNRMHTEILNMCYENHIRLMPGKVVSYELLKSTEIKGEKDFLTDSDGMNILFDGVIKKIKDAGYGIKIEEGPYGRICRIFSKDILATTIFRIMKNPDDVHGPQIVIKELVESEEQYVIASKGKSINVDKYAVDNFEEIGYRGSCVYAINDMTEYLKNIYGEEYPMSDSFVGYALFNMDCLPDKFIKEAKKRGYLSKERISRYKEHRKWKKENRNIIDKSYREYESRLLGLKQP